MKKELLKPLVELNLPGYDLFDGATALYSPGSVLHAAVAMDQRGGRYAAFHLYRGAITYRSVEGMAAIFVEKSRKDRNIKFQELEFAYEHPNFGSKDQEPYLRSDTATKIGKSWDEIDVVDLSYGRLLISKVIDQDGSATLYRPDAHEYSPPFDGRRSFDRYFSHKEEDQILPCVGVIMEQLLLLSPWDVHTAITTVSSRLPI